MPFDTNLEASPYFDDFDRSKDYYRILFKPATAVQVREVNQLQSILADQAEQFGDHILKAGTIVDGCDFSFKSQMDYAKILDTTVNGEAVDITKLNGLFVKGLSNKKRAQIFHVEDGNEGDGINLKTLYVNYTDERDTTSENQTFVQGETLEVYATDDRLWGFNVVGGGNVTAFSNTDAIAIVSAIEIEVVAGASNDWANNFVSGEQLQNADGTIDVFLTTDDGTIDGEPAFYVETESETAILRIKPNPAKQFGAGIDVNSWNIPDGTILTSATSANEFRVIRSIGSGATASVLTTSAGQINKIEISTGGSEYTTPPHVSIYSIAATQQNVTGLLINPQMYYQRVRIADTANFTNPIGVGFGMSIQSGKIYQKGLFLNVLAQFTMIDKYSNTPDAISVGFNSTESIVNVFTDGTLYDNAAGFLNQSAPGADRLKLTPVLVTKTEAEAIETADFFPIVKFSEGRPYDQQKETQYDKLGDMIAQRTYEESGNYILDPFEATTSSALAMANTNTHFRVVIDPGHAYINGFRIQTEQNFAKEVEKGTDTFNQTNIGTDAAYGSYVRVHQLAGVHSFKNNQLVKLHRLAANFINNYDYDGGSGSGNTVSTATMSGNDEIGTARIRSITHERGIQGTENAVYRIYLYDIQMNPGRSFSLVRSIYSPSDSGSEDGVADILRDVAINVLPDLKRAAADGSTIDYANKKIAVLQQAKSESLVFNTGRPAKAFTNFSYIFRSTDDNLYADNNGIISVPSVNGTQYTFPYIESLSDAEENDLIIVPTGDVPLSSATYTAVGLTVNGTKVTIDSSTPSADVTNDFRVGDWLKDVDGNVCQITSIISSNVFRMRTNSGFGTTTSGQTFTRFFPKDIPIDLNQRTTMYANVATDGLTMDIFLGDPVTNTNPFTVTFDQKATNERSTLTVNRNQVVKLTGALSGEFPKCLGVPGIFRLRAVYDSADKSGTDITDEFYIDHNQNESYYGLGYLYRTELSTNNSAITSNTICVEFDCLSEGSHGLKIIDSYNIDDETELASMTTGIHTLEIPEMIGESGAYYDLRECLDFRPFAVATATLTDDPNSATTDPTETISFGSGPFKIPKPQSDIKFDLEFYKRRNDEITIKSDGSFSINTDGTDLNNQSNPNKITLYTLSVAPYPSIPTVLSGSIREIVDTKVINNVTSNRRLKRYSNQLAKVDNTPRVYTMNEIARLENRIKALEYNQNLSELENDTTKRSIQSSVDSTIERFKFGFFVDNFENYKHTATTNPYYNASIYEYVLQPAMGSVNLDFRLSDTSTKLLSGDTAVFPNTRRQLVSQTIATHGPVIIVPEPPKIKEVCRFESNRNRKNVGDKVSSYSTLERVWEEFTFEAADRSDDVVRFVELKFFNPDGGIAYEIIQSNTDPTANRPERGNIVWAPTNTLGGTNNLQSSEAIELYNKRYPVKKNFTSVYPASVNPWFTTPTNDSFTVVLGNVGGTPSTSYKGFKGAGKIRFAYNFNLGKYITVRVHKKKETFNFEICYPAIEVEDTIYDSGSGTYTQTPPPVCAKGTFKYNRCRGTTRITYVCDGFGGIEVGKTEPNSPICGYTTVVTPPDNPPDVFKCPPAGRPAGEPRCSGFNQYLYEYTGKFKNGEGLSYTSLADCQLRIANVVRNSADCGYTPPDDNPDCDDSETGYGTTPVDTTTIDDGCVPVQDPHCPIEDNGGNGGNQPGTDNTQPGTDTIGDSTGPGLTPPDSTGGGYGGGGSQSPVSVSIFNNLPNNFRDNNAIVRPVAGGNDNTDDSTITPPIPGYGATPPFKTPTVPINIRRRWPRTRRR